METWKKTWRKGIAPLLPTEGLLALRTALIKDDYKLAQGFTTSPPPLQSIQDWPVEAADAITYTFVVCNDGFAENGKKLEGCPVGKAEEFFARTCFDCDQLIQEPAACRHFLNWYDKTPRLEMFRELLPEVERELARRAALEAGWDDSEPEVFLDYREEQGLKREPW